MADREVKDILIRVKQEGAEKVEKKLVGLSKAQRKVEKMKKLQMKAQIKKEKAEYARTRAAYERSSRFKKRIFKKHRNTGFNGRVIEPLAIQKRQTPKFKAPNIVRINDDRRRRFKLPNFDAIKRAGINKVTPVFTRFKNGMIYATNAARSFGGVLKKNAPQIAKKWANISGSIGRVSYMFRRVFGEGMMVLGAFMMIRNIMGRIGATILAVGEKFSQVEQKVMVGDAYRERLFSEGGNKLVQSFNRAVKHRADLTGESKADAAVVLSKAATTLTEFGAKYSEKTLKQLSDAAFGVAAITGEEQTSVLEKILKIAQEGKGEEKLKLGQLRLTKDINENIRRIAEGAYANPIASKVIRESSVQASMTRMKNGVHDLFANVFAQHPKQIRSAFKRMADNFTSVLSEDTEVQEAFERVLTNFTTALDETFTKDDIKRVALGAAEWSANIIDATKKLAEGVKWVINNPDKVMNALELLGKIWLGVRAFQISSAVVSGVWDTLGLLRDIKNGISGFASGAGAIGGGAGGTASLGAASMFPHVAGGIAVLGGGYKFFDWFYNKTDLGKRSQEERLNRRLNRWNRAKKRKPQKWKSEKDYNRMPYEMDFGKEGLEKLNPKTNTNDLPIEVTLQQYEKEKKKSYSPETEEVAMRRPSNQKTIVVNGDVNLNTNGNSVNEEYIMQMA